MYPKVSRLTSEDKHEQGHWVKEYNGEEIFYSPIDKGYFAISKLAYYEELEDEGLLLKLPCKIGDIVYKIHCDNWRDYFMYKALPLRIVKSIFMHKDIPQYGKLVFLNEEDARKRLANLKESKGWEDVTID